MGVDSEVFFYSLAAKQEQGDVIGEESRRQVAVLRFVLKPLDRS